jgi:hypothetical protein
LASRPDAGIAVDLGTREKNTPEDSMTSEMFRQVFIDLATYIHEQDPNHLVTSGNTAPRPFSWSLRESFPNETWEKDTVRQYLASLLMQDPEPLDIMCLHYYYVSPADERDDVTVGGLSNLSLLRVGMRVMAAANSPAFIGELGTINPTAREDKDADHIRAAIDVMDEEEVDMAAIWVWHFPHQRENNITGRSHPLLMERIAKFNRKHAGME